MYERNKEIQAWETEYEVRTRANLLWGGTLYRSSRSLCRLKVFHIAGIDFLFFIEGFESQMYVITVGEYD